MSLKILILGVNGFIGNSLTYSILKNTDWEVYGMDMSSNKLGHSIDHERFHFIEGDVTINKEWIAYHVKKCDVVLPLVAIATPATYVQEPLRVFELDFEANLEVIRQCVQYNTRVLFPSTSEVYGMTPTPEFDEYETPLTLGPIHKERWIYSCSKQMMDRVIYAYGAHKGLKYTLFRPFNWIGPMQDDVRELKEGGSRVLTQFISNLIHGKDLQLVDGGAQKRSFTYIDDGIDALMKIIENKDNCADKEIFNIGNPENNFSIRELAEMVMAISKDYPRFANTGTKIINVTSKEYYGDGYQDVMSRVPSIKNAKEKLNWAPTTDMEAALRATVGYHLENAEWAPTIDITKAVAETEE